jgi:hypothetical protein
MNVYEWMGATESEPPLHEDDSRENPTHRPQVPHEDDDSNRQHHGDSSPAGGGRVHEEDEHQVDRVIADRHMVEDMTCSNESIIEDVRKFFKFHNRGKDFFELDGNAKASMAKVYANLEKTFGSKEWLEKQTPIKGSIKVGDLADRLNLDNLSGTVQETSAINIAFATSVDNAQLEIIKQLKPLLVGWTPGKLTDKVYEKTRDGLSDVKTVIDVIKKPSRSKTSLLDGKTSDVVKPALTVEEAFELAQTILKCMKDDVARIDGQNDELDRNLGEFFDAHQEIIREDDHSESYNSQAWEKLSSAVIRKLSHNGIPEALAAFRQFEGACIAAVIYMERSFKGGKGVSVEEFQVSMEGIFDSIIGMFKQKKQGDKEPIKPPMDIDHAQELKRFVESGPATLPACKTAGIEGSFLQGLEKSSKQWAANIRADIKNYRTLVQQGVVYDKKIKAWSDKFWPELETFIGDDDRPEEFAKFLKKFADAEPKPWSEVANLKQKFIAYNEADWIDDEDGGFESLAHPDLIKGQLDIPALDEDSVKDIKNVLKELAQFVDDLDEVYYSLNYHGHDFTDAPYRGYSDDDASVEQMNRFRIHAQVSNNPVDMVSHIISRGFSILSSVVDFVVRAEDKVSNEGFSGLGKL